MKTRKYLRKLFLSSGVIGGPVLVMFSLIGVSFTVIDGRMGSAFFYGFLCLLGGVWMLKSASFHEKDIVLDVKPDGKQSGDEVDV